MLSLLATMVVVVITMITVIRIIIFETKISWCGDGCSRVSTSSVLVKKVVALKSRRPKVAAYLGSEPVNADTTIES